MEALTVLEYIVNSLVPEDVLSFAPDIVPIKAARSAVFLVSVSARVAFGSIIYSDHLMFLLAPQQYRARHRGQGDIPYPRNRRPVQAP